MGEENTATLIFVYNADSGLFNTVTDIAHKIFSPDTYSCQLCALTHGYFKVKEDWTGFLEEISLPMRFLHRDEYEAEFSASDVELPAILYVKNSKVSILMSADELAFCETLECLKTSLQKKIKSLLAG